MSALRERSVRVSTLELFFDLVFVFTFEEVAAIATPDADPRNEMSRLSAVAARYGVELLGPPPAPT
jgi:low temperature requirement protein LtrA